MTTFLYTTWAFLWRDARITTSYKFQFLFHLLGGFFVVAMFYFISKMIHPDPEHSGLAIYQCDYFSFVLVGVAATGFLHTGLGLSERLRSAMSEGSLEMMFSCPVRPVWILILPAVWDLGFEGAKALVILLCGIYIFDADLSRANVPGGLVVLLLTVAAFSVFGILSTAIILLIKRGDPVQWAFEHASALVAGAYFPVNLLPGWLETVSRALPMTYAYRAIRMTILAGAGLSDVASDALVLLLFSFVGLPLSAWCCGLAIARAKRDGSLGSF